MASDYPIITEETEFRVQGVCNYDDPPTSFNFTAKFDRRLGEIIEIDGKKVAVKGSFWEGRAPGTSCRVRVEVKNPSFKHVETEKEIASTKDKNGQIEVTVSGGSGSFVKWEKNQKLACFRE